MTHDEMIAVIQAAKEGKVVQYRQIEPLGQPWRDHGKNGLFDFVDHEYRIKPEPREFWINEYRAADGELFLGLPNTTRVVDGREVRVIHVREVVEE